MKAKNKLVIQLIRSHQISVCNWGVQPESLYTLAVQLIFIVGTEFLVSIINHNIPPCGTCAILHRHDHPC